VSHWLVINEQGEDYDIEHESECQQIKEFTGPDGLPIMGYNCLIGWMIRDGGLEMLDGDWRELPEGRYEIEGWTQKYGAIPGFRADEWDAGISLVRPDRQEES
jgi:hypothetical protein